MAQCCRNIQPSFNKYLGIQKVCLGFKRLHRNVDKKYFFKSKKSEKNKIMIWGIHYFITKLKTKIDVIPRSCFNANDKKNQLNKTGLIKSDWILHVPSCCLNNCTLYNHWITQCVPNINQFKKSSRKVYTLNIWICGHQMFLKIESVIIIGSLKEIRKWTHIC